MSEMRTCTGEAENDAADDDPPHVFFDYYHRVACDYADHFDHGTAHDA